MAAYPTQTWLPVNIDVATPLLMSLSFAILETNDATGFITSDSPCVWFDADQYQKPMWERRYGLANPGIEITLPISPHQMIFLSHGRLQGFVDISSTRLDVPGRPLMLDEVNRRTCMAADETIVVCRDRQLVYWFTPVPPGAGQSGQ